MHLFIKSFIHIKAQYQTGSPYAALLSTRANFHLEIIHLPYFN